MGSLSIWHWVIIITIIGVPILLATRYRSRTPLPFDPSLPTAPADLNWKQIYFGLNGRITRKTWWLSHLVQWIPLIAITILAAAFVAPDNSDPPTWFIALFFVWYILVIWTSICINAKRWHDTDKSGWWQLIGLVPLLGLWAFIENGFFRGVTGPNRFGPDPLA